MCGPASADGSYLQVDLSGQDLTIVGSEGRGLLTFGATVTRSGDQAGLAARVTRSFDFPLGITGKAGPEVRVSRDAGVQEVDAGLVVSAERWSATSFGSVYWLAEAHSIENAWFSTVQFGFGGAVGLEMSAGGSDTYRDSAVVVTYRIGDGPWGLRGGYRVESETVFLGVTYNTY